MSPKDRMNGAHPRRPHASRAPAARPHVRQTSGSPAAVAPTYARAQAQGRTTMSHQAAAAQRTTAPRPQTPKKRSDGPSPRATKIAALAAACVLALGALAFCYMTMWRSISFNVNGQTMRARVNTSLETLLADHADFGKQPGRLLSVGGNVLDERGGNRASVAMNGEPVAASNLANIKVVEGGVLTVENGADAMEPHAEEEVAIAPGIQMGSGGAIQYVQQWGRAGKKTVWRGERSDEVVDHEVTAAAQDMVVASVNPRPQGGKYLALTFDDGPSAYTQAILDILKEHNAKATFYNLGAQASASPDLVRAILNDGHELASHTNAHQNLPTLDRDGLRAEISSAFNALEQSSGGARPQMIRAPYGAFTATEWARSGDLIGCNVLWSIDTLDWKRPGPAAIAGQVLNNAYNGAIALMHDGGGNRQQDVEALPGIIDGLHKRGYELVTVSELMRLDGSFPEDVVNGTVSMPEDAALPAL